MAFPQPPAVTTEGGTPRRLGVELEFAGLDLETVSATVMAVHGGRLVRDSRFSHRITDTPWGTFTTEIDTALLKQGSYLDLLERLGFSNVREAAYRERVDDLLARVAGVIVPHEVVTPPIPFAEAHRLEELRRALQAAAAQGTRASLFYAFGLHLNPEAASLDAGSLVAVLRAFLLLSDWLYLRGGVDWSRRVTPYISDFPLPYRQMILAPDYCPDREQLIGDYLHHNPTRNRVLDMLPLFRHIAGDSVVDEVPEAHLVRARPAFHYRLPDCRIDEPAWTLAGEWQGWVAVEWLAARPGRMQRMTEAYLQRRPPGFTRVDQDWAEQTPDWLAE
ncbi:amidoligase family protein [Aquisalimonas lutea]|uniref:amidoligase family protein n=1 Tax=Aquisalimonas lutea TaxID=1327750 RepID=UPI0025B5C97D|nr:amidoligase family protein [Aquisalimonas lutea]MDN3517318.1 amidoligase family protein [Aquisalimonas lutea]